MGVRFVCAFCSPCSVPSTRFISYSVLSPPLDLIVSPSFPCVLVQVKHARALGFPAFMMSGQTTTDAKRQNTAAMNVLDAAGTAHHASFGRSPPPHALVFLTLEKLFAMFNGCSTQGGRCPYRRDGQVYRAVQGAIRRGGVTALVVDEAQEAWQSRYYRPAFEHFFTSVLTAPDFLNVRLIVLTATPESRYVCVCVCVCVVCAHSKDECVLILHLHR